MGQVQAQAPPGQSAAAPANAASSGPEPEPEAAAETLSDDELDALVARIALFPDPLLAVVLQAATLPLELVEAERFLEKRAKDPKTQPKKDWDASITALLNYASVVKMMSDDLEWTQALGDAVLNQLTDVQDSIQQFRAEVQAAGLLKSDDKQTVTVDGDNIKIEPAQAQVIYVPMYDGAALAAALAARPASSAEPAEAAPAQAAVPAVAAPAAAASAPVASAAAAPTAAGGTTVVYPPTYPPAYPPPAYSEPYPSFWTPAASFVGGAVAGGLLGYAIGDDDDDFEVYHHGDGYGGARNASGNKVVSGNTVNVTAPNVNRRETNSQTQAALRQRSGGQTGANSARAQEARAQVNRGGAAPAAMNRPENASRSAQQRPARSDTAAPQRQRRDQASGDAGDRARESRKPASTPHARSNAGALSDTKSGRETRKESARGAESRAAAQSRPAPQRQAAAQQRPQREPAAEAPRQRQNQANGGALAKQGGGGGHSAAASANRGAQSRGGGGRSR